MNAVPFTTGVHALKRFAKTAWVSAKAGVKYAQMRQAKHPMNAQLLRETFEELGTTYIKLGQFIASTPSLFPADYVQEFQRCFDQTPALPFSYIQQVLEEEFRGQALSTLFAEIDETPLASASIAQVHAARLSSGEHVVIKVQKPHVDTILKTDLTVVYAVSQVLEKIVPKIKFTSLSEITAEIRKRMIQEIDFYAEARNLDEFRQYLQMTGNQKVVAPKVYHQHSTQKVLTMERLYGTAITHTQAMQPDDEVSLQQLLEIMNTWFGSLQYCQSFHADLHAGNVLLLDNGQIGFIDFGIVGTLQPNVWKAALDFMQALQHLDYEAMATHMLHMGMTHQTVDLNRLSSDLRYVFHLTLEADPVEVLQSSPSDLNQVLLELVAVGERHGIKFPRDFALLFKQMLYFDRFIHALSPYRDVYADPRLKMLQ